MLASFALLASFITSFALIAPTCAQSADDWKSKLTAEERSAFSKPDNPNDCMKTFSRLAESRLKSARDYLARDDYTGANEQVLGYAGLVAEVGQFAKDSVPKRNKSLKTLELALREQTRALEAIRRDTSAHYTEVVEKVLKLVNQVRRQALNSLLGEGFLSETDQD
ncbi:MAG TPA: hypothetical protein VFZ34_28680 [Blastocatellia bacterium]|nr:hypothetical protein [Blastocatellia bacterium]